MFPWAILLRMEKPGPLTTAQVAKRAGVSITTVRRWVDGGKIQPIHRLPGLTGALLFDPEAVDHFLAHETRMVRRAV